jgi:LPS-assembly lipoprotein
MRRAAWLALPALLPLLAGCGFTPLYAEPGTAPALSGVAVVTPDHSRLGYVLREQLDDALGRDRDRPPPYRLETKLTDYRVPLGVRVNNVANRYEVGLTVAWKLVDAETGKVLTQGSSFGRVSYDSADAPYGGVAAEKDGEERAAAQAALAIRNALARWFVRRPPAA